MLFQPLHNQPIIAVCGASTCDATIAAHAEAVGREIATAGAVLLCGGGGGVMEAACRGAAQAGGLTIGILPGTTHAAANPWVTVALPTGMGHARNALIVQAAHVVIAIGGAYGTLSEIALARAMGRTVIGLHSWDLGSNVSGQAHLLAASDPATAVQMAVRQIAQAGFRVPSATAE